MASEYLKQKYKDVKPEEKKELTPAEQRKNWWDYHKWHVVIGVVLAGFIINIFWTALSQVKPDYQIAFVGSYLLPDETAAALENRFAELGEDLNGDGKVVVTLVQYVGSADIDAGMATASSVSLMGDVLECESYFFLLEDPESFQETYHTLCYLDGSLPEEGDSAEGTYLKWTQCPVLTGMDLGEYTVSVLEESASGSSQDFLAGVYFARRGFWNGKKAEYQEGFEALWDKLTAGAILPE